MELVITIIGLMAIWVLWSCCIVSSRYTREEEKRKEMQDKEKAQKKYEEYVQKFARDNKISIEYAKNMQMIKSYKEYLMEEYGVTIDES